MSMLTLLHALMLSARLRGARTEADSCSDIDNIISPYESDFLIVGMYPMRASILSRYNHGAFMRMEATRFAILQGNKLLGKQGIPLRIGYVLYDDCNKISTTTNSALDFILQINPVSTQSNTTNLPCACGEEYSRKVLGVVGTASSGTAMHLASLLDAEQIPIISYGATSVGLSEKKQYPYFRRTIPPDNIQAKLIADLLRRFNWTYVAVIHTDDTYGRTGRDSLHQLFKAYNICTSAVHSYPYPLDFKHKEEIMTTLRTKNLSRVVVLWLDTAGAESILRAAAQYKIRGKTWILTEAVARSPRILELDRSIVQGLLTVAPFGGSYGEFEDYFWSLSWRDAAKNPWLGAFFRSIKGEKSNITGEELKNYKYLVNTEKSALPRNAVLAYVHALRNYYADTFRRAANPIARKLNFNRTLYNDKYLANVVFKGLDGENFSFDKNGDPSNAIYHIYAIQTQRNGTLEYKRVAEWSLKHNLRWRARMVWSENSSEPTVSSCAATCGAGYYSIMDGQTSCCWVCVACPANTVKPHIGNRECDHCPENTFSNKNRTKCVEFESQHVRATSKKGILIIIEFTVSMVVILVHLITFVAYRNTPVARSTNLHFSLVQLVSQLFMSASLFLFFAPASKTSCITQLVTLGTFITIALSIILAKTEQILWIFQTQAIMSRKCRMISKSMQAMIILFLIIIKWCLIAATMLTHPVTLLTHHDTERAQKTDICNMDTHLFAVIVYDIILCVACAAQAYRARNLPANFNEARAIAYVTFISTILLANIIPWYSSIKDHGPRVLVLSTFVSLTNLVLTFMYSQRVRIILFQPDRNDGRAFKLGSVAYCMAEIDGQIRNRSQRYKMSRESTDANGEI